MRAIRGTLVPPGDKSISHRYALFGALAHGTTAVSHLAPGADVASTLACLERLGVHIERTGTGEARIHGRGLAGLRPPATALDAGNSGTSMRLLAGVLAGCPFESTLIGDASLSRRPMRRVIDPLTLMGARIESTEGHAPLVIRGGALTGIAYTTPVASAQVKSAIMLAGLAASGRTRVTEPMPTRDHTERAFATFGLTVHVQGTTCTVEGGQRPVAPAGPLRVPSDPSSAAVWAAAAAALPGSSIVLSGVCLNPLRLGFVRALERMGAAITITTDEEVGGEPVGSIAIAHGTHQAAVITPDEVPSLIDELPVLAARAALGGRLEVSGASELRVKESDRITALVEGFRRLGVHAEERPDGFVIDGSRQPTGGTADAASDHRLVMAFTLVGLGASGPTTVTDADAVAISYPSFQQDLAGLVA